ncbi:MAG TPA: ABC transporter ATP-binding protein, partial [Bacteroidota bacterium]|nr:ABC transporter ATP-binding protein [Bacteroidota bacterium]
MARPVIHVENVGKKYMIVHHMQNQNPTLKDAVAAAVRTMVGKIRAPHHSGGMYSSQEEFWALRDITLEIFRGERIGIIGRNGAGKSTLLKVLSRITEPTTGRIRIRGRVASLLEVGTGFHPELTGRENIFLNGAVLGMSKAEIRKKFDEIVAFAEVEKFLDTPVKRYSSGMYVRLAFAVAAHLEPEILIVDEVLAVGDMAFQRKCLGKMESVANEGRTLLFVSHNMSSILSLTQRCFLLESGRIAAAGPSTDVVREYIRQMESVGERRGTVSLSGLPRDENIVGKKARYEWLRFLNSRGKETPSVYEREPFVVELCFRVY